MEVEDLSFSSEILMLYFILILEVDLLSGTFYYSEDR